MVNIHSTSEPLLNVYHSLSLKKKYWSIVALQCCVSFYYTAK